MTDNGQLRASRFRHAVRECSFGVDTSHELMMRSIALALAVGTTAPLVGVHPVNDRGVRASGAPAREH